MTQPELSHKEVDVATEATLKELAELVGGRIIGDETTLIQDAMPLQDATPACITLIDHEKYLQQFADCSAKTVVVPEKLVAEMSGHGVNLLCVEDPHKAFRQVIQRLRNLNDHAIVGIHPSAVIDPTASIGRDTVIGPGVTIGADCQVGERCVLHAGVTLMNGCTLGDDSQLFPGVVLYRLTQVGTRAILHAGVKLGGHGFGFKEVEGAHAPASQLGWVELGDDIEIGANSCVDRGTYGATKIGDGTKIDNLVQIGHNVQIGKHNLICAQVGIAGSCSSDEHVIIAGQAGIADHLHLNERCMIGAQSGVMKDVNKKDVVFGTPALLRKTKMTEVASVMRIPKLRAELKALTEKVEALIEKVNAEDDRAAA